MIYDHLLSPRFLRCYLLHFCYPPLHYATVAFSFHFLFFYIGLFFVCLNTWKNESVGEMWSGRKYGAKFAFIVTLTMIYIVRIYKSVIV